MIILITLILLFSLSVFVYRKCEDGSFGAELLAMGFCCVFGLYIIMHLIFWLMASYSYGSFKARRDSFEQTLNTARLSDNKIELAAIIQDVSIWNEELAKKKYDRSLFLLHDYVDERINSIQPIK